jgi:hypothetical protein
MVVVVVVANPITAKAARLSRPFANESCIIALPHPALRTLDPQKRRWATEAPGLIARRAESAPLRGA